MDKDKSTGIKDLFLALIMLTGEMTGIALCAATILLRKELLPSWLETAYMLLGNVLWLGLMPIYFCLCAPGKEKAPGKVKRYWTGALKWELWILAVFCLWRLADKAWLGVWQRYIHMEALYWAGVVLLVIAAALGGSFPVHKLLSSCGLSRRVSGALGTVLTACMLCGSAGALLGAFWLVDVIEKHFKASMVSMLASHVFMACCAYGAVGLFMHVVCKERDGSESGSAEGAPAVGSAAASESEPEGESGGSAAGAENEPERMADKADPEAVGSAGSEENVPAIGSLAGSESEPERMADKAAGGFGGPAEGEPDQAIGGQGDTHSARNGSRTSHGAGVRRALGIGIPMAIAVVTLVLAQGSISFPTVVQKAAFAVEECLEKGYDSLEEGDLAEAEGHFALARARAAALECLVGEEPDTRALEAAYRETMGDVFIGSLYLSDGDLVAVLEKNVRSCQWGRDWYPVLLRFYGELGEGEELLPEQEALREELLLECIANERYTASEGLFAQDLAENKLAVRKRLTDYREELDLCGLFGLMEQHGAEGGYTEQMAYQALDMAERNPDNLLLQYMACRIASSYQTDNASHYGRTIEAARRFDKLYDDGTRTEEELADAKRFLGNVAARCYEYETALLYLKDVWELSGDVAAALSCARLYERSGEYGLCLKLAGDVLEEEPENTQALYLTAISALKTEDLDRALDAAGRLGDLVADRDRPLNAAEENNLYVCAQYLAMSDSSRWTDYTWQIYGSLTEEQAALAQSHELLWHYMTSIFQCFMNKEYGAAQEAAEKALALREDLAMGWYLKGTIAFNMENFEEARDCLEKALDCGGVAPAIYFSLANVYDAMGDYESAWLYAKKVEEMLPYQDHGNDVYGISIHNKRLLEALGKKLGR